MPGGGERGPQFLRRKCSGPSSAWWSRTGGTPPPNPGLLQAEPRPRPQARQAACVGADSEHVNPGSRVQHWASECPQCLCPSEGLQPLPPLPPPTGAGGDDFLCRHPELGPGGEARGQTQTPGARVQEQSCGLMQGGRSSPRAVGGCWRGCGEAWGRLRSLTRSQLGAVGNGTALEPRWTSKGGAQAGAAMGRLTQPPRGGVGHGVGAPGPVPSHLTMVLVPSSVDGGLCLKTSG